MRPLELSAMAALAALAACTGGARMVEPPTPIPVDAAPALPPIPAVDDALHLSVVYPPDSALLATADSNFIFGAAGTGLARLSINGMPVPVAPNGAWLGFLPVPRDGVYRLWATNGQDTVLLERTVVLPPVPVVPADSSVILETSMVPTGAIALPIGESIDVGFQGTAGGQAAFVLPDGRRVALIEQPLEQGGAAAADFRISPGSVTATGSVARYRGAVAVEESWVSADTTVPRPALVPEADSRGREDETADTLAAVEAGAVPGTAVPAGAYFELVVGFDTVRAALNANVYALSPEATRAGQVRAPAGAPEDWTIRGRPGLTGPFHWFWPPGALVRIDGERNGQYRVRLTGSLSAWVPAGDVALLPPGAPLPAATVSGVRMSPGMDAVDLRVMTASRLPFRVDGGERTLDVTVYGATSEVNFLQYGGLDPYVARAAWSQPADGEFHVTLELTAPVWGYDATFDDSGALVVRIRRPPAIDPDRPLSGLLIAVDPGHPPTGATGPTGLTEAEANLGVARELRPLLEAAGARVLMTRTDDAPVDLGARPSLATAMNAHVLLSLHNNAFPDGVNPFRNNGTSVYYFQPHSLDLARAVQAELLTELRLRDIGIGRADLALVRPTWMPSILSETMFLMIPEQESALRDPAVRKRIAEAHFRALERFLRARAAAGRLPDHP